MSDSHHVPLSEVSVEDSIESLGYMVEKFVDNSDSGVNTYEEEQFKHSNI